MDLMRAHVERENEHDLDGILATFSDGAVMSMNGIRLDTVDGIRAGHVNFGMTQEQGGLEGTIVRPVREYFIDERVILVEGLVLAKHTGQAAYYPPTGRDVELPYFAFYEFDDDDKLVEERVTMNMFQLALRSPRT